MDAAEQSIRQNGYNAVSFRELADDLGIKSASVHYHFRKKEDLGLALVERYSKRFFENLKTKLADTETSQDKLRAFIETYGSALKQSDAICLCGILGAEISSLPEPLARAVNTFFKANLDWLNTALPDQLTVAQKAEKARYIVAALQGAMMLSTSMKSVEIFDQTGQQLLAHSFDA